MIKKFLLYFGVSLALINLFVMPLLTWHTHPAFFIMGTTGATLAYLSLYLED